MGPRPHAPVRTRSIGALSALVVGAGVLASCVTGGQPESTTDHTFDIAIGVDLDTVDPVQMTTTTVQNVVDYGVETLTEIDKNAKIHPGLATSWSTSRGGRSVTFQLRKGVEFTDGTRFDAEAVKFNLDRLLDPKVKVPVRRNFEVIRKVTVLDTATVRLDLAHPDPNLLNNLSSTIAGIVSPASAKKEPNSYTNIVEPVGTGPYEFVSFRKGDRAVYEKNPGYWGKKPYYHKVVFHIAPEGNSREALLKSGQADMIMNPPVADLEALQADEGIDVLQAPSDRTVFVALNTTKPPFDDRKVRQALNYAVDKKSIASKILFGAVDVVYSPFASSLNGYCKAGRYDYDPAKAKRLLADAGVERLTVTFGTPTGRYLQDKQAAQAIAANLKEVGVTATVRTMDWPTYQAAIIAPPAEQEFDMHILGWAPGALDAPSQFLMFQKSDHPPNGLATSFYTDKRVELLIARGNVELDENERNAMYCQAQKQIWADAPWIFLWSQTLVLAHSSDVTGVSYIPNEKFDTIYAKPAE